MHAGQTRPHHHASGSSGVDQHRTRTSRQPRSATRSIPTPPSGRGKLCRCQAPSLQTITLAAVVAAANPGSHHRRHPKHQNTDQGCTERPHFTCSIGVVARLGAGKRLITPSAAIEPTQYAFSRQLPDQFLKLESVRLRSHHHRLGNRPAKSDPFSSPRHLRPPVHRLARGLETTRNPRLRQPLFEQSPRFQPSGFQRFPIDLASFWHSHATNIQK